MKRIVAIVIAAVLAAGCNTVAGVGKDVEAAGRAIDKTATETKKKM
jgi:predicted small secreted protein